MPHTNGVDNEIEMVRDRLDLRSYYESENLNQFTARSGSATACCPFHEDRNPSLSINFRTGLWNCFGGCGGGSVFQFYQRTHGVSFPEALQALANRAGVTLDPLREHRTTSNGGRVTPEQERAALDAYEPPTPEPAREIDNAIPLAFNQELTLRVDRLNALTDLRSINAASINFYQIGWNPSNRRYTIPIRDEYEICRNIRQWSPEPSDNAPKMCSWREGFGEARLFPLPLANQVHGIYPYMFIMEGEWDCLLARQLGLNALTGTGGAGVWREEWNQEFRGRDVVICYDADQPGRAGALAVEEALLPYAHSVRRFDWTRWRLNCPEGFDFTDFVVEWQGSVPESFLTWVENEEAWGIDPVTGDVIRVGVGQREAEAEAEVEEEVPPLRLTIIDQPAIVETEPDGGDPPNADDPDDDTHPADPDAENLTDSGNAIRLVRMFGESIRYAPGTGWLIWDTTRWKVDTDDAQMLGMALTVARTFYVDAMRVEDRAMQRRLTAHARTSENGSRLREMIKLAAARRAIRIENPDDLDADHWLLNTPNGTIDLRTGANVGWRKADLITKLTGCALEPWTPGSCPAWETFVSSIMQHDQTLIDFLQRAVGYAMTGSVTEQVLFMLHGQGANGKTTFLETITKVLGDYATTMNFTTLAGTSRAGPSEDVARLRGHRFVTSIETGRDQKFNETLLRQITGGDTMAARVLYHGTFTFHPVFKLFIGCNELPNIKGTEHAIWRRIKLVPFLQQFSNEPEEQAQGALPRRDRDEVDRELEQELPRILGWMLAGCLSWRTIGLASPPGVMRAVRSYRADMDDIAGFLEQRTTRGDGFSVLTSDLYNAYKHWCEENDRETMTQIAVGRRLTQLGFATRRRNGMTYRLGLSLDTSAAASAPDVTEPDF